MSSEPSQCEAELCDAGLGWALEALVRGSWHKQWPMTKRTFVGLASCPPTCPLFSGQRLIANFRLNAATRRAFASGLSPLLKIAKKGARLYRWMKRAGPPYGKKR